MRSLLSLGLVGMMAGCSAELGVGPQKVGRLNEPVVPSTAEHEPCDLARGEVHVFDGPEGQRKGIRVQSGGVDICHAIDHNQDGKPDSFVYFDPQGQIRRREHDRNFDGKPDEVEHFVGGVIVRRDRETDGDGKVDTWDIFKHGAFSHTLVDTDGNGKIDEWWWLPSHKKGCAEVHKDVDGDGKVDRQEDRCKPGK